MMLLRYYLRDIFVNFYLFPTLRIEKLFFKDKYMKTPVNYCMSTTVRHGVKSQLSILLLRCLIEGPQQKTQERVNRRGQNSID